MNTNPQLQPAGVSFIDVLGKQDFSQLAAHFHSAPRVRLLTPSALTMPPEASAVGGKFQQWFGEVERAEVGASGGCLGIRYRIHLREHGDWYTVEQQAYCRFKDGLVERMDLLCSGFQPDLAPDRAAEVRP